MRKRTAYSLPATTSPAVGNVTPKLWKRDEIHALLDVFDANFRASVDINYTTVADLWNCISAKMKSAGYAISAAHCQSKWSFLYKTFQSNPTREGSFYDKIKEIVEFDMQQQKQTELAEDGPEPTEGQQADGSDAFVEDAEAQRVLEATTEVLEDDETVVDIVASERLMEDGTQPLPKPMECEGEDDKAPGPVLSIMRVDNSDLRQVVTELSTKVETMAQQLNAHSKILQDIFRLQTENNAWLLDIKNRLNKK